MSPDEHFDELAELFAPQGVTAGSMFGKRALMLDGKGVACLKGEMLAFKLGDGTREHAEALAVPGAELFDPSGKHRPFKDWVAIPASASELWPEQLTAALSRRRPVAPDIA